jgi:hypothetical protein
LQRHLEASGKARKGAASDAEGGARGGFQDTVGALCADTHPGAYSGQDAYTGRLIPAVLQPTAGTLGNRGLRSHTELDGHGAYIPVAIQAGATRENPASGPDGIGVRTDGVAYTIEARAEVQAVGQPVPYDLFQITAPVNRQNRKPGDPCHTLARDNAAHAAIAIGTDCYNGAITGDVAATMGTPGSSVNASGPTVMQAVAFKPGQSASAHSIGAQEGVACTLEAGGGGNNKQAVALPINGMCVYKALHDKQMTGIGNDNDPMFTMRADGTQHAVAHSLRADGFDASEDGTGRGTPLVPQAMTVRRLTPVECERLQGFPDNWTLIPWRKKPASECPDGPRYKALGNSMACNCMAWIGEKIAKWEADHA